MSGDVKRCALMSVFADVDSLVRGIQGIRASGLEVHTVFSPAPDDKIGRALATKGDSVRYFALIGGVMGCIVGYGLSAFALLQWSLNVSGKPILGWVPFTVMGYEMAVIAAVIFTVLGMLVSSRIPRFRAPRYYDPRFTEDVFGLLIFCSGQDRDKASMALHEAGAREIHENE